MGWDGGGAVGRSQTRPPNRTENALGLPLRCEAEAATASSPTLRPRREVLPPSESTHARDRATFSEDPCGPICGSRASPSSSGRIRSMIPVDDPSKWVELRTRRWSPPPIPRWNRERPHLSYCPRVDPKLSRRFPSAVRSGPQEIEQAYQGAIKTFPQHNGQTIEQISPLGNDADIRIGQFHLSGQGQNGP